MPQVAGCAVPFVSGLPHFLLQVHFVKAAELITDAVAEEKGNIAYGFSKVCSVTWIPTFGGVSRLFHCTACLILTSPTNVPPLHVLPRV